MTLLPCLSRPVRPVEAIKHLSFLLFCSGKWLLWHLWPFCKSRFPLPSQESRLCGLWTVETAWHILTRSLSSFALSHVTWKKPIAVASMQHVALCLAATSAKTELWSSICAVCISLQPLLKVYSLLHSTFFTRSILGHFSIRLPCKGSNLLCQTAQPPSSSCSWN